MNVYFKKLTDTAIIPSFGNGDDENAGLDFYAIEETTIKAHKGQNIHTGIAWEPGIVPLEIRGFFKPAMIIKGRSGLAIKQGIEACNAGVIDQSYRGEILIRLYNTTDNDFVVFKGDRIAQGVVILVPCIDVFEADNLSDSRRGTNGFGSSGK